MCVCKYACTWTCTSCSTCVDVRGQLKEVCSFHHVGSRNEVKWGLKSGGQAWRKSLLPTELSCQPHPHYFIATEFLYPGLLIVFCCFLPSEILFSFYIFNDFGLMILDRWLASLFVLCALHAITWILRRGKQTPKCLREKKTNGADELIQPHESEV